MRRHGGEIAAQRILHVAVNDPDRAAEAVPLGVFLGQHGVARGDLNAGDMDLRHRAATQSAATPVPIPASKSVSPLAQGMEAARKTASMPAR